MTLFLIVLAVIVLFFLVEHFYNKYLHENIDHELIQNDIIDQVRGEFFPDECEEGTHEYHYQGLFSNFNYCLAIEFSIEQVDLDEYQAIFLSHEFYYYKLGSEVDYAAPFFISIYNRIDNIFKESFKD